MLIWKRKFKFFEKWSNVIQDLNIYDFSATYPLAWSIWQEIIWWYRFIKIVKEFYQTWSITLVSYPHSAIIFNFIFFLSPQKKHILQNEHILIFRFRLKGNVSPCDIIGDLNNLAIFVSFTDQYLHFNIHLECYTLHILKGLITRRFLYLKQAGCAVITVK
jgi:hypothetical protein